METPRDLVRRGSDRMALTGVVEDPASSVLHGFHAIEELWTILANGDGRNRPRKQAK